jgi:DNA invertase Pin-like site-specific DNA recombinase
MPIALIYCRQSRGRGAETRDTSLSLDAQEQKCRDWCERERRHVEAVYRDHDLSGASMDRAEWQAVVARVKQGGIDEVVTFASSRVARDNMLFEQAYRELLVYRCQIISVSEPGLSDDMMRGFLGLMSQAERKRMGRFISAAATERKRRGVWVGGVPFGFRRTGHPGERLRAIEPDPEAAPIARGIADRLLAGASASSICVWLNETGVPARVGAWRSATIQKWARCPALAGGITLNGETTFGHFPGIVSPAEFAAIGRQLDAAKQLRGDVRAESWIRGSLYHACGRRMTVSWVVSPATGARWLTFRCPHVHRIYTDPCPYRPYSCSAGRIESAALTALATDLAALLTPADVQAAWRARRDADKTIRRRSSLVRDLGRARDARDRAESLYLSGRRDALWLAQRDAEHDATIAALQTELDALDVPPDPDVLTETHAWLASLPGVLAAMRPEDLTALIRRLGTVYLDGNTLAVRYAPVYQSLIPAPTVITWR